MSHLGQTNGINKNWRLPAVNSWIDVGAETPKGAYFRVNTSELLINGLQEKQPIHANGYTSESIPPIQYLKAIRP